MTVGTGVVVGLVLLGVTSGFGLLARGGLLLGAAMVAAALMGCQRRGQQGERDRLAAEYGLSGEEAHSVIRLVESGKVGVCGRLLPAAHDHAQRQLDPNPTSGWVLARGIAVVFGGYITYAVIHPYPSDYLARADSHRRRSVLSPPHPR